jgi:hypothetical protein
MPHHYAADLRSQKAQPFQCSNFSATALECPTATSRRSTLEAPRGSRRASREPMGSASEPPLAQRLARRHGWLAAERPLPCGFDHRENPLRVRAVVAHQQARSTLVVWRLPLGCGIGLQQHQLGVRADIRHEPSRLAAGIGKLRAGPSRPYASARTRLRCWQLCYSFSHGHHRHRS